MAVAPTSDVSPINVSFAPAKDGVNEPANPAEAENDKTIPIAKQDSVRMGTSGVYVGLFPQCASSRSCSVPLELKTSAAAYTFTY